MSRALAITLLCAGLCLTCDRDSARAADAAAAPTATPTPVVAPTTTPAPEPAPAVAVDPTEIPPFLLPLYRAAGARYGVPWPVLAAINGVETDYGRNVAVSSAGAIGWMQFMPASWRRYGVDADGDGVRDPYDPADAIYAAARYLRAAGSAEDLPAAIFAYNHADWYVDEVLARARSIGDLPNGLVESLAARAEGRSPLAAGAAAEPRPYGREARLSGRPGAPVVAVTGGRIVGLGDDPVLGRFVRLRDASGTTFTYGQLGRLTRTYPAPLPASARDAAPPSLSERRLFAHPARPRARAAGGARQLRPLPRLAGLPPLSRRAYAPRHLRVGARVQTGTILGRLGRSPDGGAPVLVFAIQPAGDNVRPIAPVPVLQGWESGTLPAAGRPEPRPWGARLGVRAAREVG